MKTIEFEIPKGFEIDKEKTTKSKIILKYIEKQFVDLGLPSGTLWANKTEEGYYTYDEAIEKFQDSLPTIVDFAELVQYCKWKWQEKGMLVTGPNGNSITLPALGYRNSDSGALYSVGSYGYCWSASPYPSISDFAYYLYFSNYGDVIPANSSNRGDGYSVRCIKRK